MAADEFHDEFDFLEKDLEVLRDQKRGSEHFQRDEAAANANPGLSILSILAWGGSLSVILFLRSPSVRQPSNYVLFENTCICTHGVAAMGSACESDGDTKCTSCPGGYFLDAGDCIAVHKCNRVYTL